MRKKVDDYVSGRIPPPPIVTALGITMIRAADGTAEFAYVADGRHANPMGTLHGEIRCLRKEFEGTVAVENLDLEVRDKEFVVLLGPSGCGKTTTLRCIAGLEEADGGEIYIGDRLVNDLDPKERNIAMVFQSYALYPHMTVYGNMGFPRESGRLSEREIVERVNRTARLLQIEG